MKQLPNFSSPRAKLQRTCVLLGLILAALLAGIFALFLPSLQNTALGSSLSNGIPDTIWGSTVLSGNTDQEAQIPDQIGGHGSRVVNILLVGQDRRENEGRTRADTMLLCTFNKKTRELTMTSFLRDLYVKIPGHGSNRINAAYAFGGMELLEETLQENFGLQIDGTVEVDFSQFSSIVDVLGGVEMELREDEAALINQETGSDLSGGTHHLNGDQALAYSRIRKLDADGDFSRTNRQRKVLSAILDGYRDAKLSTLLLLVNKVLPMVSTDLGAMEIMGYALELAPLLSGFEIKQQHVPASGTYTDQNIDGMAVLVPDLDAARQMLANTLIGS